MADEKIRYVLDVDDKGTAKLVKFGNASETAGKKAEKSFDTAGKSFEKASDRIPLLGSAMDTLAGGPILAASLAVVALGAAFVGLATDGNSAIARMESLEMGMKAVMGSSVAAEEELKTLQETAKLPGLGYEEAVKMSISLQATGMSAGLARKAMTSFGNALATVGKGKAELDGVGTALSQIMSKGKISAEEINQIAERVPQIRVAMQAAFGTADTEVLQKMKISSVDFITKISDELGKLEKATGGLKNGAKNLSDQWFLLKNNLADVSGISSAAASMQSLIGETIEGWNAVIALTSDTKSTKWSKAFEDAFRRPEDEGGGLRELDALTAFKGYDPDERARILKGYYENDEAIISSALARNMATIVNHDKAVAAEAKKAADDLAKKNKPAVPVDPAKAAAESLKRIEEEQNFQYAMFKLREEGVENERKLHESAIAFREAAYDKQASIDEKNRADAIKALDDENALIMKTEEDRLKYNADLEKKRALAQAQAVQDRNAAIAASFAPLQGFMQSFSASLLNGEASMAGFLDSFKQMIVGMVAELAANAAIFGLLNLVSGGAAGSFLGGLGGLSKLVLGSFAVGTRSLATTGPILAHQGDAILPRGISQAARAGDWAPAMRFMGQPSTNNATTNHINVTVHGGGNVDPNAIAQSIIRAQAKQSTRRLGGSF